MSIVKEKVNSRRRNSVRAQPSYGRRNEGVKERSEYAYHDVLKEKVMNISGPTFDLKPEDEVKKFCTRSRLYVGNIGRDVTEEDLKDLFKKYGETSGIYMSKEKMFAFIRLDFYYNAVKAKQELDGIAFKNRIIKVRFAPNPSSVKVQNLSQFVSNELLQHAFSVFGDIERAVICVDSRGRPTGEGIVDFVRKNHAMACVTLCKESCFFITGSLRPCIVQLHEEIEDLDGYPEKNLPRKSNLYYKEREVGPRFAIPGSFEEGYGNRWKQLFELHSKRMLDLKEEFKLKQSKLEDEMEQAKFEHETECLKEVIRLREANRHRHQRDWDINERRDVQRRQRMQYDNYLEMQRRNQENELFAHAHNLCNMLDEQEQGLQERHGALGRKRYSASNWGENLQKTNFDKKPKVN